MDELKALLDLEDIVIRYDYEILSFYFKKERQFIENFKKDQSKK
jgi:hypothetical protein